MWLWPAQDFTDTSFVLQSPALWLHMPDKTPGQYSSDQESQFTIEHDSKMMQWLGSYTPEKKLNEWDRAPLYINKKANTPFWLHSHCKKKLQDYIS